MYGPFFVFVNVCCPCLSGHIENLGLEALDSATVRVGRALQKLVPGQKFGL